MSIDNSHQISDVKVMISQGADGVGIESIEKTSSQGIEDTYTITLSDGRKSVFTVTNGNGIDHIAKTGEQGLVDEYTIYFDDNSTYVYYVTNGQGGGMSAELLITSDAGSTITVTNPSGQTIPVSQVTGSTTQWSCSDTQYGTYTVESDLDGDTVTVSVTVDSCKIYSVNATHNPIPDGSTVLPTDDIQIWLACAEIEESYTTLAEVLADTATLSALLANDNAVDYLVRSTTWAVSESLVPIMTDNTHPSGVASMDSIYQTQYAYYAFDNNDSTYAMPGETSSASDWYLEYEFDNIVKVSKLDAKINTGSKTYIPAHSDILFQVYNEDTSTWDTLISNITADNGIPSLYSYQLSTVGEGKKFRLTCKRKLYSGSTYDPDRIYMLQMYTEEGITDNQTAMSYIGLNNYCANTLLADDTWLNAICNSTYFESVLNVKVPTMTSDSTPSGTCSASSVHTTFTAYKAFNGAYSDAVNDRWLAAGNELSARVNYAFTSDVKVKLATVVEQCADQDQTHHDTDLFIESSSDGLTWSNTLGTLALTDAEKKNLQKIVLNNNSAYGHYSAHIDTYNMVSNTVKYCGLAEVQFYGREDL